MNEIINQRCGTYNETGTLFKIRDVENFSVHYFKIKKEHFNDIIKIYEFKYGLPRQFITERGNQSNLLRTFEIIVKLHDNYLKFYKIIL